MSDARRNNIIARSILIIFCLVLLVLTRDRMPKIEETPEVYVAEVYFNNQLINTMWLDYNTMYIVPDTEVIIEVKDGTCGFLKSNCEDQICVQTSYLEYRGQYSDCYNNGIRIKIAEEDENKDK